MTTTADVAKLSSYVALGTPPVGAIVTKLSLYAVLDPGDSEPSAPGSPEPIVRAWTFTLDGHDFYVLRLNTVETLVYDTHSEQWSIWGNANENLWDLLDGTNWGGGHAFSAYGSDVMVGSDTDGSLYFLDPNGTDDEDADGNAAPFRRETMAQYFMRGYDMRPCWGVQLLGSIGDVADSNPTDVTLSVSDDRGDTFFDCGTVTVPADSFNARVDWQSLGSMSAPGRLFKIVDYGALHRIDSLEMPGAES